VNAARSASDVVLHVRYWQIVLQNSQNAERRIFREKTKQATITDAGSNPLPESPVSLARGGVAPYMIIRSSRLRLGEFEPHAAKRLLQHYRHFSDLIGLADDARC
jgi:hypothetical protein